MKAIEQKQEELEYERSEAKSEVTVTQEVVWAIAPSSVLGQPSPQFTLEKCVQDLVCDLS